MTAKEFLSQAYRLDHRINAKIEQVSSLNCLATKCTSALSCTPGGSGSGRDSMAETIDKIVDLKKEINADIDRLVDLKKEIIAAIEAVNDTELQILLEKRYLCFKSWEKISVEMEFSIQHVYRLHNAALKKIVVPSNMKTTITY